ncbi:MAG: (d)CMP kinase [Mycoplasmoidaceae bacterium]
MTYKIAIDGPAGSGKSSLSKIIAKNNNILFLSSGIFYRGCAFILKGLNINDNDLIKSTLEAHRLEYKNDLLIMNGKKINEFLFTNEISELASKYSSLLIVREYVNNILRDFSRDKSVIMEGRDIGTVVLKNAELKFYLKAGVIERARRRQKELKITSEKINLPYLIKEIAKRDWRDKHRKNDPLKKAKDAIVISTRKKSLIDVTFEVQKKIDEFLECRK